MSDNYSRLKKWAKDAASGKTSKIPYIDITDLINEVENLRATIAATEAAKATGTAELPPLPWQNDEYENDFEAWLEPLCDFDIAKAFHDYAMSYAKAARQPAPVVGDSQWYTCIGKGGEYELIGTATGAGTVSKLDAMRIYRSGNRLFYRTADDFDARMQRIHHPSKGQP